MADICQRSISTESPQTRPFIQFVFFFGFRNRQVGYFYQSAEFTPFRSEGFFTYPPENNTFSSEISRRSRLFLSLLLYHWQYSANLRLFSPTRQLLQIPNPLLQNSRFPPCRGGCFLKMLCNMTQYRFAMYIYSHIPHNTAFPRA